MNTFRTLRAGTLCAVYGFFLLSTGCKEADNTNVVSGHHASDAASFERGPHGGRMLRDGGFAVEIQIFETGVPPQFRVYGYKNDKLLSSGDFSVEIKLTRLGSRVERFFLEPRGEFRSSDQVVSEPHSFDVVVLAEHGGSRFSWSYSSPEARTSIPRAVAELSGVRSERAAGRVMKTSLALRGKIVPSEHKIAHVIPRFSGVVREGRKHVGDPVQKGEVLAIIESNQSLQPFEVRSQVSGTVISGHLIVGEFVPENQWVYIIADLSEVWADFFVPLQDRHLVKIGQEIVIKPALGDMALSGAVSYIAPYADERTQSQLVRVVIANPRGDLLPGMFVSGGLVVEEVAAPVAVKSSAIQRFRDWNVVFVRYEDTYEARPVTIGRTDHEWVEVTSGLAAHEEYVTENSYLIKSDILKSGASHDH
jgi:cobalt-zinc-cadmium efflux system membrane fusion protein